MEKRATGTPHRDLVARSGPLKGVHPVMGITSVVLVSAFVAFTNLDVERAATLFGEVRDWIALHLAGYYVAFACGVLILCLGIIASPYGRIRLGSPDEKPEFSNFSWIAMLFSAAVGIGLLFWSIAEPIQHFEGNPFAATANAPPNGPEAARVAMRVVVFHWGLHGWAIYALVGLSMAYFTYCKGLPLTIRSSLYPFLGDRIFGLPGHVVDLLAILGTIFGTATSLGMGAIQMSTGFNYLFGLEPTTSLQILLIGLISIVAILSAVSGLNRGIRILSEWNIRVSAVLLAFFLIAGPTVYLVQLLFIVPWEYVINFIPMGIWVEPDPEPGWQSTWTLFYWGWYISWAPFVGMFFARISRGRTIRGFLVGAVIVPTLLCIFWLCLFGGTALNIQLTDSASGLAQTVSQDMAASLYRTLELMDVALFTWPVAGLATILIASWFITSADSMTLVVCTILSLGNPHPPNRHRIFWGTSLGLVASALLLAGGLQALQTASIVAALPFSIVLLLMATALVVSLVRDGGNGSRRVK